MGKKNNKENRIETSAQRNFYKLQFFNLFSGENIFQSRI